MGKKFVSWRRVSTFKQNRSGLGLEAQKEIIRYFIERDGGDWIADYSECYTGTELSGCVELRKAITHAKKEGAVLIIAKTDRFRNTIEALQVYDEMGEGNIMFCDLPSTEKFTLTLFFALAEREALLVSIRTKQALQAKKRQGAKLGASSPKYKETLAHKTKEEIDKGYRKRTMTMKKQFLESEDVRAFCNVLCNVFPNACDKNKPRTEWTWRLVTTSGECKNKCYALMKDYKELNPSLFASWDFNGNRTALQVKLAGYIRTLRNSYS